MEKNTENYNLVKTKFENCLKTLNFKFRLLDLDDDDINYDIYFNASQPLKFVNALQGVMYANLGENSVSLIVVNIYSIPNNQSITPFYKLVNDANNKIMHGKFSVRKDIRQIVYTASVDCGNGFKDLTENKISLLVNDYSENLMFLFMTFNKNKNITQK